MQLKTNTHNFECFKYFNPKVESVLATIGEDSNFTATTASYVIGTSTPTQFEDLDDYQDRNNDLVDLLSGLINSNGDKVKFLDELLIAACGFSTTTIFEHANRDIIGFIADSIEGDDEDPFDQTIYFLKAFKNESLSSDQVDLANEFFLLLCDSRPDEIITKVIEDALSKHAALYPSEIVKSNDM